MSDRDYVLVTPARNEERYIGNTIEAVAGQSLRPSKWVIVSNASVDRTDEIVQEYARRHSFLQFIRSDEEKTAEKRDFGAKVRAFRLGYSAIQEIPHAFVGNLDADITFGPHYFEQLLARFHADPKLGVGGGIVLEPDGDLFVPQQTSLNSVCGSVQMFRRACYESFGGYVPMRLGGVDAAAEILARMHGWTVRTFTDIEVYAQRPVVTGAKSPLHTKFRQGMSNYLLGYHPLFQLASSLLRMGQRPYVIAGMSALLGYIYASLKGYEVALPGDAVKFLRSEQMSRLTSMFRRSASAAGQFSWRDPHAKH